MTSDELLTIVSARAARFGVAPFRTVREHGFITVSLRRERDGLCGSVSLDAELLLNGQVSNPVRYDILTFEVDAVLREMDASKIVNGEVWRRAKAHVWLPRDLHPAAGDTINGRIVAAVDYATNTVTFIDRGEEQLPRIRVRVNVDGDDLGAAGDGEILPR